MNNSITGLTPIEEMPTEIWAYKTIKYIGRGTWYDEDVTGEHTPPNTVISYTKTSTIADKDATIEIMREALEQISDPTLGCTGEDAADMAVWARDALTKIQQAREPKT